MESNREIQQNLLDIVKVLSLKENQILLSPTLRGKFFRRKLILKSFFSGKAKFSEILKNFQESLYLLASSFFKLPQFIKRPKSELMGKLIFDYFFGELPRDPVDFFHYKLHYLPVDKISIRDQYLHFLALAELIRGIAILDQYRVREFIKKDSVIVDVGANIGVFSLFANYFAPQGKVYAFEPSAKTFQILQRNISDNNLSGKIFAFQQALGEKEKKAVELLISSDDSLETDSIIKDSEFLKNRENLFFSSETISMTTLDNFIFKNKVKQVDFLKIDVEGYEKQVIRGAREIIKQFSPVIACSAYHLKDDVCKIPELVMSINPRYQYRLENRAEKVLIFWINQF